VRLYHLPAILFLSCLSITTFANPIPPKRTLTNATDCLVTMAGKNPRLLPWVQYTFYAFINADGKRIYSGVSVAPGETKDIPQNYDSENQLYFDVGPSKDTSVTPYVNYYWVDYAGPGYIVRYEDNGSATCSNSAKYPYVPCFEAVTSDPCASLR